MFSSSVPFVPVCCLCTVINKIFDLGDALMLMIVSGKIFTSGMGGKSVN